MCTQLRLTSVTSTCIAKSFQALRLEIQSYSISKINPKIITIDIPEPRFSDRLGQVQTQEVPAYQKSKSIKGSIGPDTLSYLTVINTRPNIWNKSSDHRQGRAVISNWLSQLPTWRCPGHRTKTGPWLPCHWTEKKDKLQKGSRRLIHRAEYQNGEQPR